MRKIIHFILDHRTGGPHVYVQSLMNSLSQDFDAEILTTGQGPLTDVSLVNLRRYWRPLYLLESTINVVVICWRTRRYGRTGVVFDVHGASNVAPILAARILSIPVVWHFHETAKQFLWLSYVGRWVLSNHPHRIVVVAKSSAEVYKLSQYRYLPAGIDPSYWSRNQVAESDRRLTNWYQGETCGLRPLRIVTIANLNPLKGIDILLQAMQGVERPCNLKIVGAALDTHRNYATRLKNLATDIEKQRTGTKVDFLGWQSHQVIRAVLATADCFVLPSRSEACPIALLEAVSMNCYSIAADVGDVQLILVDNGAIFQAGDVVRLRVLISEVEEKKGGTASHVGLSEAFHIDRLASEAKEIYHELLSETEMDRTK